MATYTKLTLKTFKQKLDSREYKSSTGARRAVGKVSGWSSTDKIKAQGWINAHFGVDSAPATAKKKVAKKAVKRVSKKVAARATSKKAVKRVVKKAAKKVVAKATTKKARKAPKATRAVGPRAQTSAEKTMLSEINIVGERVGTVAQAIQALETAKAHGADVKKGMQEATDIVTGSMTQLKQQVQSSGSNGRTTNEVATKFAESQPVGLVAEIGAQQGTDAAEG